MASGWDLDGLKGEVRGPDRNVLMIDLRAPTGIIGLRDCENHRRFRFQSRRAFVGVHGLSQDLAASFYIGE